MVIPFTLCSLLFYRSRTRERARAAHRHRPGDPGSRPGKSPLRGPLVLCRLTFGSGTSLHPCRLSPPPASLRAAPVSRQRLIDFQPDPVIAVTVSFSLRGVIAVKRNMTGISQPSGRGRDEGCGMHCCRILGCGANARSGLRIVPTRLQGSALFSLSLLGRGAG